MTPARRASLHRVAGVLATCAVTAIVVLTGGEDSGWHVLFLVVLVHAAIAVGSRWVLVQGALAALVTAAPVVYQPGVPRGAVVEDLLEAGIWIGVALVVAASREHQREIATQLRRSDARYRSLFDRHPHAVDARDRTGALIRQNSAAAELVGVDPQELAERPWTDFVPPEYHDEIRRQYTAALRGESRSFEAQYRRDDGSLIDVAVTYIPTVVDGRVTGAYQISQNITARKRAQADLALYRQVLDQISDAVVIGDPTTRRFLYANPAAAELYAIPLEELVGAVPSEISATWTGDVLGSRIAAIEDAGGDGLRAEFDLERRDGTTVPVESVGQIVTAPDGRSVLVGVLRDVSGRHAAERAIRESERRFRTLAEGGQSIVYLLRLEPEPHFEFVNEAVEDVTGFAAEDFYADPSLPLARAHPEDRDLVRSTRTRDPEPGSVTTRFRHRDGRWVWLEDRYTPITDVDGRVTSVQGVMFDVSARREAEQALESALRAEHESAERLRAVNEMQTAFLQAVSHELRTPLTSIAGYAQTLERHWRDLPPQKTTEMLGRLHLNAERLSDMLQDLLDVDRLSRGTVRLALTAVDLSDLCRRVVDQIELHEHPVRVEADRPVVVRADGPKVERIVENLVYNAGKHTPSGTTIWVRVEPVDGGGRITVEDTGPGIPPELREQIFEPFRQGPDASSAPSPGTGIGLALVARFSELHGGKAWVEEARNGGAAFHVELPTEPPQELQEDPVAGF